MAPMTKDQFNAAIGKAARHQPNAYNHCVALSISWEHNDFPAAEEINDFQQILRTLNLPVAEKFTLRSSARFPGWNLREKIGAILTRAKYTHVRALVLIHYTGHAFKRGGALWAKERNSPGSPETCIDKYLLDLKSSNEDEPWLSNTDLVDVVYFLDCCYADPPQSRKASAAFEDHRLVEIIAATDNESYMDQVHEKNTLTGKIREELCRRKRDGHKYVEVADLIQTIRSNSPVVKPSHCLRHGIGSVCLPLAGTDSDAQIDPKSLSPSSRAVFSIHITDQLSNKKIEQFLMWIRTLPPAFQISLDGIYHTHSTVLLLCGSWSTYAKLRGLGDICLAAEVSSLNLAPQIRFQAPSVSLRDQLKGSKGKK